MPIAVECPSCHKKAQVPDNAAGRNVKCGCGTRFAVPAARPQFEVLDEPPPASFFAMPPPMPPQPGMLTRCRTCGRTSDEAGPDGRCPCGGSFAPPAMATPEAEALQAMRARAFNDEFRKRNAVIPGREQASASSPLFNVKNCIAAVLLILVVYGFIQGLGFKFGSPDQEAMHAAYQIVCQNLKTPLCHSGQSTTRAKGKSEIREIWDSDAANEGERN